MARPTWDETFMEIARVVSQRATCPRLHAGAVIVNTDRRILSTGYNGAPSGLGHCTDEGCLMEDNHCVRTVHAEINALASAARIGVPVLDATIYLTARPCIRCVQVLINAGISRLVYRSEYDSDNRRDDTMALLQRAGVTTLRV